MAKFPNWLVGLSVNATQLGFMVPNIVVKAAAQSRNTTAVVANDSELINIPLAVGTHYVRLLLLAQSDTTATPDIKTRWAFTGTWNNPSRACFGPAITNVAARNAITPVHMGITAAGTDQPYGFAAGTTLYNILEESYQVVVTVTGNLSFQWSQNTSDASNTTVGAGTAFETRQIA